MSYLIHEAEALNLFLHKRKLCYESSAFVWGGLKIDFH